MLDIQYSRDGQQMLFIQPHSSSAVLWRARADGAEMVQLTDARLFVYTEKFSPDGKRVTVMGRFPNQPWRVYWVSSEGGALHEVAGPPGNLADPTWSPDGQTIVFGLPPTYWTEPDAPRGLYRADLAKVDTQRFRVLMAGTARACRPMGASLLRCRLMSVEWEYLKRAPGHGAR
jgi:dipeptidyl aminopeptidase/acylaminoacyl peptidase